MEFVHTQLFGGAITCDLPKGYEDISNFRQVPDNQECFANPLTDSSLMIDILEYSNVPDDQVPALQFEHIAELNEVPATERRLGAFEVVSDVIAPNLLKSDLKCTVLRVCGYQQVAKFKEAANNTLKIYLAVIRLPDFATDIVLSHNVPVFLDPASSSTTEGAKASVESPQSPGLIGLQEFERVLSTFKIENVGLFGG